MTNKGQDNVIPHQIRSAEKARELGRKGGIKSGETRRRKREARKLVRQLFDIGIMEGEVYDIDKAESLAGISGQNITAMDAIVLKQIQLAINGDLRAAQWLVQLTAEQESDADIKRERKTKIERIEAETARIKEETALKTDTSGIEHALKQTQAIAELINNPADDRVLSDYTDPNAGHDL